jgi:hypothetical protein
VVNNVQDEQQIGRAHHRARYTRRGGECCGVRVWGTGVRDVPAYIGAGLHRLKSPRPLVFHPRRNDESNSDPISTPDHAVRGELGKATIKWPWE